MDYIKLGNLLKYVPICLLSFSIILLVGKRYNKRGALFFSFICVLLFFELISFYFGKYQASNIFLIPIIGYTNFLFLLQWYTSRMQLITKKLKIALIVFGAVILIFNFLLLTGTRSFYSYGTMLYNLSIVIFSLLYFNAVIIKKITSTRHSLLLNISILFFFLTDVIISLALNYLINQHLNWVAPFWIFRAILLQLFYISLILYVWNTGKTQKL
ncbi:hypothetical protein C1H87_01000 [Flavivirga eckloniae]|uniref:YhhN-like protein n=1 Tax=Flavivirga eckloniae TaxID=1803846 RepID=A0A2K9PJY0_9FLAO|nr:hypothetical protein C1H87_01000 [Flavivirga eckloniae]